MTMQPINPSESPAQLYAAVDLGSNSFHLVVVRVHAGSVQIIGKVKQKVRLAAGLDNHNHLDELSMERGWRCLETFAERLQDIPPQNIRIVGTATLRLATNASTFLERAEQILSHPVEVISGEEEARQIYLGVAYTSANQGNSLVIDIGGASTEVIIGNDMQPLRLASIEMGCVTFMGRYFADGRLDDANFAAAIQAAKDAIQPHANQFAGFNWQQCLGASGTPQAITEILVSRAIGDAIRLDYLYQLRQECVACSSMDRLDIQGLAESRKAIFPSGLAILIGLFETLKITQMQISGGALREGLIYGMLENMQGSDIRSQSLQQAVQRFHVDLAQALRVHTLAQDLLAQLHAQTPLPSQDAASVLQAAAMLHEIGLHIEYKGHHLHGAYLLDHISLPGYSRQQQQWVRDLVLLHRHGIQLKTLASYSDDMAVMTALCRILRLANVLCVRRKDDLIPKLTLKIDGEHWQLGFPSGWLKQHPLLDVELANEKWLQHKAGWPLNFN